MGHVEGDFFFISEGSSKPPEPQQPETLVDFRVLVFSFQKQKEKKREINTALHSEKHNFEPNMHYFFFVGIWRNLILKRKRQRL